MIRGAAERRLYKPHDCLVGSTSNGLLSFGDVQFEGVEKGIMYSVKPF